MNKSQVEYQIPPIHWPKTDQYLKIFLKNEQYVQHNSPMFTPRLSIDLKDTEEYSYSRVLPKYIIRGFKHKTKDPSELKSTFGLVYFTSRCTGAPGLVQGGALSTVVDTVGGDLAISSNNSSNLYFTRKITILFTKFVRLETVVRFDCTFMTPPASNSRENDVFVNVKLSDIDTGKLLVDCICNMAKAGPNPETFLQAFEDIKKIGWEETWKKQPQVVIIPNNMKGFWGEKAINDCEKLINLAPVELNLVDMRRDFPVMNNNASRTETIYNNPPNQIFWDFSPTTVSLLVDRRNFIVFFFFLLPYIICTIINLYGEGSSR